MHGKDMETITLEKEAEATTEQVEGEAAPERVEGEATPQKSVGKTTVAKVAIKANGVKPDPNTTTTYSIVPPCHPTARFDTDGDNVDNDCDGLTDFEDPDTGLFPVKITDGGFAWTAAPSLPHISNTAFLAMVLASDPNMPSEDGRRLKCWALSQAGHILGTGADESSYVVGLGPNPPKVVQHRQSSCPAEGSCSWSHFYVTHPNPQLNLIKGALVAGPHNSKDEVTYDRKSSDMRVTLHENVGFVGMLAGLETTGTHVKSCEQFHGVYQKVLGITDLQFAED